MNPHASALLNQLGLTVPVVQAPMAGANGSRMVIEVCRAGGLGSLPCAMLTLEQIEQEVCLIRSATDRSFNLNFFCHDPVEPTETQITAWTKTLEPYYKALNVSLSDAVAGVSRAPFDEAACCLVEDYKPAVVSFHFGLPARPLFERVKASGCFVLSSATTVREAVWLEQQGCDAVIAQGFEAGGHRGMFLDDSLHSQLGTMALIPQVVDALTIPVIGAGGIADGRGVAAAMLLGASAVQVGTAYLKTPESIIGDLHRHALDAADNDRTAVTNVFSGKPARGLMTRLMNEIGPISDSAPPFPSAGGALAPLKQVAERSGRSDFTSLWSGQAANLAKKQSAAALTEDLARSASRCLNQTAQAEKK